MFTGMTKTEIRAKIISDINEWFNPEQDGSEGALILKGEDDPTSPTPSSIEINEMSIYLIKGITVTVAYSFIEVKFNDIEIMNIHMKNVKTFDIWY